MAASDECEETAYSEPTPMWYHSYGLDYEGNLKRGNELQSRRHQIMVSRLPEIPQLWEVQNRMSKVTPPYRQGKVVLDVKDPAHHSWACQTQKDSQSIGWFADPNRLPRCRFRDWSKHYSFV